MAKISFSIILFTFNIFLCYCQTISNQKTDDDVCLAPSSDCGEKLSDSKDDFKKLSDLKDKFPASWVDYLHKYEKSKIEQSKSCKGKDIVEGISIQCHYAKVIEEDLKPFPVISLKDLDKARDSDRHSVTYQLINGQLYRSPDCLFPSRCEGIEHFMLQIKANLSNFEFVLNTHDWPFINRYFYSHLVPLFSFSKTSDHADIFFPAWTFWSGGPSIKKYPKGLGRWDIMRDNLKTSFNKWPWNDKEEKGFFRGSRTSSERDNIITLGQKKPELVDAMYTKNQAWKSIADSLGMEPVEEVSLEEHCKYKYLFNFRGVAASFRFKHLFLCGSLVFHVGDEWEEFFYKSLRPWYHYVPVPSRATEQEIEDLLLFVKNHPEISETIASNGYKFVRDNLNMIDVENYWNVLLKSYSKLLSFQITKPNENFIQIK